MLAKLVLCYFLSAPLLVVIGVFGKEQSHIDLNEEKFDYVLLPNEKEIFARWKISVQGTPSPTLYLYVNNELIDSASSKYKCKITNETVIVKIRNVSENVLDTKFSLFAENINANRKLNLTFNVTNLFSHGIEVHYLNETDSIIKCVVKSVLKPDITWFACDGYNILDETSCLAIPEAASERTELQVTSYLHNINPSWSRFLKCVARNSIHSIEVAKKIIKIDGSMRILGYGTRETVPIPPSKNVHLRCAASALNHTDKIKWASNSIENDIEGDDGLVRLSSVDNTVFAFWSKLTLNIPENNFPYIVFCKTWLKNGTMEYKQIELTKGIGYNSEMVLERNELMYFFFGATFVAIVITSVFLVAIKIRACQKFQKEIDELNIVGLANFEEGVLEHLNPNLTLDDQADLLPYDKMYEFPMDQLKLGDVIESGAFGVVVKGEARGIFENEPNTTVAVKMVHRNIGDIYIKALVSELKVLIHLGKHINVVNLLGACTKNIRQRELLVIVEHCRFGNLKDYLLNHRRSFIDQINPETDQLNFSADTDVLGVINMELSYVTPFFSDGITEQQGSHKPPESENEEDNRKKEQTNQNVYYKSDYSCINRPVCTRDLVLWSFQVARGMEYLSSRKVLHGDLAARNILLTDGNVVKISDFGSATKMYQNDIYKKKGHEALPVKWMAIEAITDGIFSVQSDVWSFGIVLWEFFSLARVPYPGIECNESFCKRLLNGYRMKSPQFATQEIYAIMLHCWHAQPTMRPSFTDLSQEIGSLLEKTIRDHYIDMNAGYVEINRQRFNEENKDYLSMVGVPDFNQYSSSFSYANIVKV